jgi:hypothetical protein
MGRPMIDFQSHLETLRKKAAEAALISQLASASQKRELFARVSAHLDTLAGEIERAMGVAARNDGDQSFRGFLNESFTDRSLELLYFPASQGQSKMTFDAMAAAVDWLDAYRAGDIEAILAMYADDAVVECGCGDVKYITGKDALRAYWKQRLVDYPASDLDDLQSSGGDAIISYLSRAGVVGATLEFDARGRIARLRCGPSK